MEAEKEITAAYIGIGDELLAGSTQDSNFLYLAQTLRELGIRLVRGLIIPDDLDAIQEALHLLRHRVTYVFTSGGLGPTHDDVTVDGVARALGVGVIRDPILEKKLREYFGQSLDESSLKMASVPEGASLHFCDRLLIPVLSVDNIYLFPGIPELFRQKLDSIKERFRTAPYWTEEILCGQLESEIADILLDALDRFPTLKIGSYPKLGRSGYSVKIVLESKDRELVERAAEHLRKLIA
jgi:FAD synthetase